MNIDPRESYSAKVVVGFAIVLLIGGVLGTYTVIDLAETARGERLNSLGAEADVQEDTASSLLTALENDAVRTADTTSRIRQGAAVVQTERARLHELYSDRASVDRIDELYLVEPDSGDVVVSSEKVNHEGSATDFGFSIPSELSTGEVRIELSQGVESNQWVLYTKTPSGGVLVQTVPLSHVESEIGSVLDFTTTRIVDQDGVVVYDGQQSVSIGGQHTQGDTSPAVEAARNGKEGTVEVAPEESPTNERVITGYDNMNATGWAVVTYTKPEPLFVAVSVVQRGILLLLGGLLAALIGFGLVIERPTVRQVGSLRESVAKLEAGDLDTTVETDRRDEFGDLSRGLDTMRVELREQIDEAQQAQQEAQQARMDAETLSSQLETKAEAYRGAIESLAEGDFTARVDPDSDHEGMQAIGESLNDVAATLEETLAEVQTFADEVADSMAMLSASAGEIERASDEVAQTVQSISSGTDEQREQLRSVVGEMNDMSATVEEIASTAGAVAESAEAAAELSDDGQDAAEDASEALDEIETVTEQAVGEVEQLVEQVEQIEEFADVIGEVAEQTDMLALNANIEAARTDTDADGFAVVADEIKSLATEAGQRADDIERLVGEVSDQTDATADRMQTANEQLRSSNDTVQSAIDALIEISDAVESTNEGVQDINRATDDQAATTEEVTATVEEVETIAADSANEANQAAAAAEEQTATVSEVARTADEVADEADSLRAAAAQFTVDPSDGDESAPADDGRAADEADEQPLSDEADDQPPAGESGGVGTDGSPTAADGGRME